VITCGIELAITLCDGVKTDVTVWIFPCVHEIFVRFFNADVIQIHDILWFSVKQQHQ